MFCEQESCNFGGEIFKTGCFSGSNYQLKHMTTLRKIIVFIIVSCGGLLIIATGLSLFYNSGHWFLRLFNFPRLQVFIALFICLVFYLLCYKKKSKAFYFFITALIASLVIQGYIIFPYTPLAFKKVPSVDAATVNPKSVFSIIVVNVLMYNRQSDSLLAIISRKDPTFVLTMEVNTWWVNEMNSLNKTYPYHMLFPTDNTYGMCLYSKLPLDNPNIYFLNHDSVPSFHTMVSLPGGAAFQLLTLHPVAPKPSDHPDNVRDEEVALLKAANMIAGHRMPALAAGDFNDVGWSHNSGVFRKISGLNDVRSGRGFYNTFERHILFYALAA